MALGPAAAPVRSLAQDLLHAASTAKRKKKKKYRKKKKLGRRSDAIRYIQGGMAIDWAEDLHRYFSKEDRGPTGT